MRRYYRRRSYPRVRIKPYSRPRSRSYSKSYYSPRLRSHSRGVKPIALVLIFGIAFSFMIVNSVFAFLSENSWLVLIAISIPGIILIGYAIYKHIHKKYENFVLEHSVALKKLLAINSQYAFVKVPNMDMENSYDNDNFYADISPLDYLTYQLAYYQKGNALRAISEAEANAKLFPDYLASVEEIKEFDKYDTASLPIFQNLRKSKEQELFKKNILNPITQFKIRVTLTSTNINGAFKDSKSITFNSNDIKQVIVMASQKDGDFFVNENVWQSICRVERGKVTNKMRFAIYNRDGNRCRRCGSRYDLEVDHIFPISKGGKSTFDNLQTLCHRCNSAKSNTIEAGVVNTSSRRPGTGVFCERCGAQMVKRNGPNGSFYGCPNYPKCTYTKQIR